MKKLPIILTFASSLLLAACGGDPVPSSEPIPVYPESSDTSSPSSSSATPIETTIEAINDGEMDVGDMVVVSGVITSLGTTSDIVYDTFFIQDGTHAITVRSYVDKEKIVVGSSVTVTGKIGSIETIFYTLEVREGEGSLQASSQSYTYEDLTDISSVADLSANYGRHLTLSSLSFVSLYQEGRNIRFYAKYKDVQILFHFHTEATGEGENAYETFYAAISSTENPSSFSFSGPIVYTTDVEPNRLMVYHMSHVSLVEA